MGDTYNLNLVIPNYDDHNSATNPFKEFKPKIHKLVNYNCQKTKNIFQHLSDQQIRMIQDSLEQKQFNEKNENLNNIKLQKFICSASMNNTPKIKHAKSSKIKKRKKSYLGRTVATKTLDCYRISKEEPKTFVKRVRHKMHYSYHEGNYVVKKDCFMDMW